MSRDEGLSDHKVITVHPVENMNVYYVLQNVYSEM